MRSGWIYLYDGAIRSANLNGYWWSSYGTDVSYDNVDRLGAYDFAITAADVLPSNGPWERNFGYSLRCLSTVLDMYRWRNSLF